MERKLLPKLDVKAKMAHISPKDVDVVLIQDSNLVRGNWKLEKVSNVYPGADGKVRRVDSFFWRGSVSPTICN